MTVYERVNRGIPNLDTGRSCGSLQIETDVTPITCPSFVAMIMAVSVTIVLGVLYWQGFELGSLGVRFELWLVGLTAPADNARGAIDVANKKKKNKEKKENER